MAWGGEEVKISPCSGEYIRWTGIWSGNIETLGDLVIGGEVGGHRVLKVVVQGSAGGGAGSCERDLKLT